MITRWEAISDKTAVSLKLSKKQVKLAILDMAAKIVEHASHPNVMETDLFGIGVLVSKYGRLLRIVKSIARRIEYREKLVAKYRSEKYLDLDRATRIELDIEELKIDLEAFQSFIDTKKEMLDIGGRDKYVFEMNRRENWATHLKLKPTAILTERKKLQKKTRGKRQVPDWRREKMDKENEARQARLMKQKDRLHNEYLEQHPELIMVKRKIFKEKKEEVLAELEQTSVSSKKPPKTKQNGKPK